MPTDRGSEPDGPPTALATEAGSLTGDAEPPVPALTLAPGDHVGRYAILERIGSGGMGVVFAAYDPALDRKVALKLLRPRAGARASAARERLAREARAMARLDHPNVLAVHDVGTFDEQVFLAMDFVEGGTLRTWLQRPHRWHEIVDVFVAAGEGLAAAHDAGLVHRDFKPDNVLLSSGADGTPRPRVTDFGLVRGTDVSSDDVPLALRSSELPAMLGPLTATGALVGTPGYMAPEQFAADAVTPATDQFSFCVALYEALLHQLPFEGDSAAALAIAVTSGQRRPTPPNRVPRRVLAAIERGLAISPQARWPAMRPLLASLRATPRRSRAPAIALGVGAIAAIGGAWWLRADPCPSAQQRFDGIWDPPRREQLRAAMFATGAPFAADAWRRVEQTVPAWTEAWLQARRDACQASELRHEQSDTILDRRMACLDRALDGLAGALDVIALGDVAVVERVASVLATLGDPHACDDTEALLAQVPLPADLTARAEVERLERQRLRAEALAKAGHPRTALTQLAELHDEASRIDHPPLVGRIALTQAHALAEDGRWGEAIPMAKTVAWQAHAAHDDVLECEASVLVLASLGAERRFDEIADWQAHARADVARLPGTTAASLQLSLVTTVANLDHIREDFDAARRGYLEAQQLCEQLQPTDGCDDLVSHLADVAAASGDLLEALRLHEQALAQLRERVGEAHPSTALRLAAIATVQRKLGELTLARANFDRAVAILAAIDPQHADLAAIYNNRAVVELFVGDYPAAQRDFEAALEDRRARSHGTDPLLPALEGNLAMVVFAQGNALRALSLHQRSLAGTIAIYGEQNLDVANALANIGDVLSELQLHDQAESYYRRALEIRTQVVGVDHPDTARTRCNLGGTALAQSRPQDALEQYQLCLDGYVRVFGSGHAQLAMPEAGLGEARLAMGLVDAGIDHLRRARALVGDDAALERARIDSALARAIGRTDVTQGSELLRAALIEFERHGALAQRDAAEARRWLREHGG